MQEWSFANIGFDTVKKLWMIEFFDEQGTWPPSYYMFGSGIEIHGGAAKQFEWHDPEGKHWHVRERIYREDVEKFEKTAGSSISFLGVEGKIIIHCKQRDRDGAGIPDMWETVNYAYNVMGNSRGFAEFYNADGKLLCKVDNRWILVEGITRRTIGEYPNIRLQVKREDVSRVLLTDSALVFCGKPYSV